MEFFKYKDLKKYNIKDFKIVFGARNEGKQILNFINYINNVTYKKAEEIAKSILNDIIEITETKTSTFCKKFSIKIKENILINEEKIIILKRWLENENK